MSKINLSWGCCELGIVDDKYLICTQCNKAYHLKCINNEGKSSSSWKCPLCLSTKSKAGKNDNTPVRSNPPDGNKRSNKRPAMSSPSHDRAAPITREDVQEILQTEMAVLFSKIDSTIASSLSKELKAIKADIFDLKESITFIGKQYEDLKRTTLDNNTKIATLQEENNRLAAELSEIKYKYNQMEQVNRSNNIEIQCVPECKTENLINIVSQLGNSVGCTINDENVLNCTRVAKINPQSPRPRAIVVQLSSPRLRDTIVAAVWKYNKSHPDDKLNTSHVGIRGDKKPIFVSEHLSAHSKAIHAAARIAAKDKGYKYVWVRNGRVYMRKTDNSDFKYIRDIDSIKKLN